MTDITINLSDENATTTAAHPGDKITWHNDTTNQSITFNPPSCVAPPTSSTIAHGGNSTVYTVNANANGSFNYSFDVGAATGLRNGTITISPR